LDKIPSEAKSSSRFSADGNVLKWIAVITMVIDHTGVAVIDRAIASGAGNGAVLQAVYTAFRSAGRISFPVFCFLLTEGFFHTHSRKKYGMRLLVFAFLSEIPFDLAVNGKILEFSHQNIFFTLFIGLAAMDLMERKRESIVLQIIAAAACAAAAELIHSDYGWFGIALITVLYLFHGNRRQLCLAGGILSCLEIPAPLAFIPIFYYNGRRGRQNQYFFYVFYPAHLLLLYFLSVWILHL